MRKRKEPPRPSFMDGLKSNNNVDKTINLLGDVLGTQIDSDKMKNLFNASNTDARISKNSLNSSMKYIKNVKGSNTHSECKKLGKRGQAEEKQNFENSLSSTSQPRNSIGHITNSSAIPGELTMHTHQSSNSKNYDFRTNRFKKFQRSVTQKEKGKREENNNLSIFNESAIGGRGTMDQRKSHLGLSNMRSKMMQEPEMVNVKRNMSQVNVNEFNFDSPQSSSKQEFTNVRNSLRIHEVRNQLKKKKSGVSQSEQDLSMGDNLQKIHEIPSNHVMPKQTASPKKRSRIRAPGGGSIESDRSFNMRNMGNSDRESFMEYGRNRIEFAESLNFTQHKLTDSKNTKKKSDSGSVEAHKILRRNLSMRDSPTKGKRDTKTTKNTASKKGSLVNSLSHRAKELRERQFVASETKKKDSMESGSPPRRTHLKPKSILKRSAYDLSISKSHHEIALSVRSHISPSKRFSRNKNRVAFRPKPQIFHVESYKGYNKHTFARNKKQKNCCEKYCNLQ